MGKVEVKPDVKIHASQDIKKGQLVGIDCVTETFDLGGGLYFIIKNSNWVKAYGKRE